MEVAAGIFDVAQRGRDLSTSLLVSATSISTVDQDASHIAGDVALTSNVLTDVGAFLNQRPCAAIASKAALEDAKAILEKCRYAFDEIRVLTGKGCLDQDHAKRHDGPWSKLNKPLRSARLKVLKQRLESLKSSLLLLLSVLNFHKDQRTGGITEQAIQQQTQSIQHNYRRHVKALEDLKRFEHQLELRPKDALPQAPKENPNDKTTKTFGANPRKRSLASTAIEPSLGDKIRAPFLGFNYVAPNSAVRSPSASSPEAEELQKLIDYTSKFLVKIQGISASLSNDPNSTKRSTTSPSMSKCLVKDHTEHLLEALGSYLGTEVSMGPHATANISGRAREQDRSQARPSVSIYNPKYLVERRARGCDAPLPAIPYSQADNQEHELVDELLPESMASMSFRRADGTQRKRRLPDPKTEDTEAYTPLPPGPQLVRAQQRGVQLPRNLLCGSCGSSHEGSCQEELPPVLRRVYMEPEEHSSFGGMPAPPSSSQDRTVSIKQPTSEYSAPDAVRSTGVGSEQRRHAAHKKTVTDTVVNGLAGTRLVDGQQDDVRVQKSDPVPTTGNEFQREGQDVDFHTDEDELILTTSKESRSLAIAPRLAKRRRATRSDQPELLRHSSRKPESDSETTPGSITDRTARRQMAATYVPGPNISFDSLEEVPALSASKGPSPCQWEGSARMPAEMSAFLNNPSESFSPPTDMCLPSPVIPGLWLFGGHEELKEAEVVDQLLARWAKPST